MITSRKAQEAAMRRFQATEWLESMVGPLDIPNHPSENDFICCLRNGLILCHVINKVEPGSVPKVVEINRFPSQLLTWDSQPLPAYQFFENVRNFLKAIQALKIPVFEPSVFEKDNIETGSFSKIVDCILGLKEYNERKHKQKNDARKLEDLIVKVLGEHMIDAKENLDGNFASCIRNGHTYCQATNRNRWQVIQLQEKKLMNLKELLSNTRAEFRDLQSQLQNDLKHIERQIEGLSTAAQGYHKVVQENRTLYNMLQDLKGNILVYCRIRPAFKSDTKNVINYNGEDGSLVIDPSKPNKDGKKIFQFNRVFSPTATQGEVFADTQPLIRSVMDGYNVCIFAYGQTGSGKTHTMCGPSGASRKELGINYLALSDLFDLSNTRKDDVKYELFVQMVEIYNEQVRDLLISDSVSTGRWEIRSCTSENGSLLDATMHPVKSITDVLNLMRSGQVNRAVSSTALNNQSSRSHSILTVHVHGKDINEGTIRSCLHLVDLAGSERVDKSGVTGEGLKEAQYINKSLSCLGDVITALSQKNSYIPYRNSKLTLLLQNSLGGNAKTLMFAHVSPESDSFEETVSTLKFAQRASTVELGTARLNKESREIMDLKQQVESLKKQLGEKEPQSAQRIKKLELRSPLQKPKAAAAMVIERTPPRTRRLSIEPKYPPKTPNSKSRLVKTAVQSKTPEAQVLVRNEILISSEIDANGKSSNIKKSIQTIRKLINGSDKRSVQLKTNEVQSSRRQSLTGIRPFGGVDGDMKVTPFKENEVDVDSEFEKVLRIESK